MLKTVLLRIVVAGALTCVAAGPIAAQDEARVLAVVQAMFDAMENRDVSAYAAIVTPYVRSIAIRTGDSTIVQVGDEAGFLQIMASTQRPAWLERMFDPEVRVEGPLATVWTRYDFHLNGRFSHCGIDSFQLIEMEGEWKITQITYTTVSDEEYCANLLGRPVR